MLNIILVEDDPTQREYLTDTLKRYLSFEMLDAQIILATADPTATIEYTQAHEHEDFLFLLDIEINNDKLGGFQLALELRKLRPFDNIVFITAHEELSLLALTYHIQSLDYILKKDWEYVLNALRKDIKLSLKALEKKNILDQENFSYRIRDRHFKTALSDIYYFESVANKPNAIIMHAKNQVIEFRGSLKQLEEYHKDYFFRCHKRFLINLNAVYLFSSKHGKIYFNKQLTTWCPISIRKSRELSKLLKKKDHT